MSKFVEFFNGYKMPIIGLGTWQATDSTQLETAMEVALEAGYRHFDTAYMYGNEAIIGKILKSWLDAGKVKREELFIVTKLPFIGMRPKHVSHFLDLSLTRLQLSYLDLYLVHSPFGLKYVDDETLFPKKKGSNKLAVDRKTDLEGVWKIMEEQVDKRKARSIGISNFSPSQIDRIMNIARIQPANHQVELHVEYQQRDLVAQCNKYNIRMTAYGPIGSPGRIELLGSRGIKFELKSLLKDPLVMDVAKKYGKTPAQILLRFLIERDIAVIPKSTNPNRLKENIQIFDFNFSEADSELLASMDEGVKGRTFAFDIFPGIEDHPEFIKD